MTPAHTTRELASHILELDDIHKTSTVHGAAPIVSAALAVMGALYISV